MNIRQAVSRMLEVVSSVIFGKPRVCALCGSPLPRTSQRRVDDGPGPARTGGALDLDLSQSGICARCLDKLSREMSWVCQVCGAPIRHPLRLCPDCRKNMYVFDGQRSAGIYQGDLKNTIARMKFQGERWLSRPLAYLLAGASREFLPADLLVPVPLEPGSSMRRGYNQAQDLAKELSALLGVPVMDILKREKRYAHQAELGRNMRWGNLKESMRPQRDVNLRGERVLLVDDVTTTGATLDEAARVLKGMGAEEVYCVTAARTMKR
jgi:ComF family protein